MVTLVIFIYIYSYTYVYVYVFIYIYICIYTCRYLHRVSIAMLLVKRVHVLSFAWKCFGVWADLSIWTCRFASSFGRERSTLCRRKFMIHTVMARNTMKKLLKFPHENAVCRIPWKPVGSTSHGHNCCNIGLILYLPSSSIIIDSRNGWTFCYTILLNHII